jgi:hypothetical protein
MQPVRINPIYLLVGLIIPVLLLLFLLRFAKILWFVGMVCAPILLLITYFINKKPITDHLKMLGAMLAADPIKGIFYSIFSLVGLPFLALFFLGKALVLNKVDDLKKDPNGFANAFFGQENAAQNPQQIQNEGEYADYEEIETVAKKD